METSTQKKVVIEKGLTARMHAVLITLRHQAVLITLDFAIAKPITRVWTMSITQIWFLVCKLVFP